MKNEREAVICHLFLDAGATLIRDAVDAWQYFTFVFYSSTTDNQDKKLNNDKSNCVSSEKKQNK